MVDFGDKIQQAWRQYIDMIDISDAKRILKEARDVQEAEGIPEDEREYSHLYVAFSRTDDDVEIDDVDMTLPDYWHGAPQEDVVADIPLYPGITKKELQSMNIAEETHYWDNPYWDKDACESFGWKWENNRCITR